MVSDLYPIKPEERTYPYSIGDTTYTLRSSNNRLSMNDEILVTHNITNTKYKTPAWTRTLNRRERRQLTRQKNK